MRRIVIAAAVFAAPAIWPFASAAAEADALCGDRRAAVTADSAMRTAVVAAYGRQATRAARRGEACIVPHLIARTGERRLLVTSERPADGGDCHSCPAKLSAFVLTGSGEATKAETSHRGFTEAGHFGEPGVLSVLDLGGGRWSLAIETGSIYQGNAFSSLALFEIDENVAAPLTEPVALGTSNSGALAENADLVDVDAKWRVVKGNPTRLIVEYSGTAKGKRLNVRTVYELGETKFVLVSGKPPEFEW